MVISATESPPISAETSFNSRNARSSTALPKGNTRLSVPFSPHEARHSRSTRRSWGPIGTRRRISPFCQRVIALAEKSTAPTERPFSVEDNPLPGAGIGKCPEHLADFPVALFATRKKLLHLSRRGQLWRPAVDLKFLNGV